MFQVNAGSAIKRVAIISLINLILFPSLVHGQALPDTSDVDSSDKNIILDEINDSGESSYVVSERYLNCYQTCTMRELKQAQQQLLYQIYSKHTQFYSDQDIHELAGLLHMEGEGLESKTECSCIAWTVLNRVDDSRFPNTIHDVIIQEGQFDYDETSEYTEYDYKLAHDVLYRWSLEKLGYTEVGRTLPSAFIFFYGDEEHNYFYGAQQGYWDYSLPSPYMS